MTEPEQTGPLREQIPDTFERVCDHDYEETHVTFKAPDGQRFRMPRDEIILVRDVPDLPDQPPRFWAVVFKDSLWFFRGADGWWYPCGRKPTEKNRSMWADLWTKHGNPGYSLLVPVSPNHIPVIIGREGPIENMVLPDLSSGDPEPGILAHVDSDRETLLIRNIKENTEMEMTAADLIGLTGLFFRTQMKMKGGEEQP